MNNIKFCRFLYLGILFIGLSIAPTSLIEAATLHAFLIADTTDSSIGNYTKVDIQNMKNAVRKIVGYTKLVLKQEIIVGKNANASNVLSSLNRSKIKPNDVVLFYYSGHGFRTTSKDVSNPWPNLAFTYGTEALDFAYIGEKIANKNPRLFLAIADVCNNVIPDSNAPILLQKMEEKGVSDTKVKDNYKKLFLETKGTILIAGAQPGEYSWATPRGSLYSLAFLASLDQEVKNADTATWENLLSHAVSSLIGTENPIHHLDIE